MNTIDDALVWLGHLLEPLGLATTSDDAVRRLLEILGWSVPAVPQCVRDLGGPLAGLLDNLATLLETRMEVESDDAPPSSLVAPALAVAGALAGSLAAVRALPPLLRSELGAAWVDLTAIDIEFEPRLLGWLIESELRRRGALLHALLAAVGVLERTPISADPTRHQPPYTRITLRPERLVDAFRNPGDLASELYGWRTSAIDEDRLLGCLFSLGVALGAPGEFRRPTSALSRVFAPTAPVESAGPRAELWLPLIRTDLVGVDLVVQTVPATAPGLPEGLALSLVPYGDVGGALDLGEGLTLTLEASAAFASGLAVVLRPLVAPALHPRDSTSAGAATTGTLALVLGGRSASDGAAVVELTAAGVGVSLHEVSLVLGAAAGGAALPSAFAEVRIDRGELRLAALAADGGDGFFASLLPGGGVTVPLSAALRWSGRGLSFTGSGGLEVETAIDRPIGPLRLGAIRAGLELTDVSLEARVAVVAALSWGPVHLVMNSAGFRARLGASPGNLGPVDLSIGWFPPSSIGLAIDASAVRGGGFIERDASAGRYSGALALEAIGVGLAAIGVLDTAGPGYSLAAIIAAEFRPVPLPLGFTLEGVGGLIGIHRRVDTDALRAALRTPAGMGDIFFPADPIAQAGRLTTDLARYFPAAEGRYVFGPAVKFGWGAPTVVRGTLAVLLELPAPARVVVLGTVTTKLPTEEHAVVDLAMDVVGEVDFGQKRVAVDASLRSSTIAGFPITGDLAFRMPGTIRGWTRRGSWR
ncbi:MAG: hypothetical protein IPL61_36430 [Myxococcales bacterium]|nr:hypothetical protein [Myxococcales bacterium]